MTDKAALIAQLQATLTIPGISGEVRKSIEAQLAELNRKTPIEELMDIAGVEDLAQRERRFRDFLAGSAIDPEGIRRAVVAKVAKGKGGESKGKGYKSLTAAQQAEVVSAIKAGKGRVEVAKEYQIDGRTLRGVGK